MLQKKRNAATVGKRLGWKWTMDTHTKQVYYPLHLITVTTLQSYKNANSDSNREHVAVPAPFLSSRWENLAPCNGQTSSTVWKLKSHVNAVICIQDLWDAATSYKLF